MTPLGDQAYHHLGSGTQHLEPKPNERQKSTKSKLVRREEHLKKKTLRMQGRCITNINLVFFHEDLALTERQGSLH